MSLLRGENIRCFDREWRVSNTTCSSYLRRNDEELSILKKQQRPGRPSSVKEELLKQLVTDETREYETGLCKFI